MQNIMVRKILVEKDLEVYQSIFRTWFCERCVNKLLEKTTIALAHTKNVFVANFAKQFENALADEHTWPKETIGTVKIKLELNYLVRNLLRNHQRLLSKINPVSTDWAWYKMLSNCLMLKLHENCLWDMWFLQDDTTSPSGRNRTFCSKKQIWIILNFPCRHYTTQQGVQYGPHIKQMLWNETPGSFIK